MKVKDLTAAEKFILKNFSSNVIYVRMCNKFITDVSSQIMKLINHFEREEATVFDRFEELVDFLTTFLSKFLVNGGRKPGVSPTTTQIVP